LQLHAVADHLRQRCIECGLDLHAAAPDLRREQLLNLRDGFVDVERLAGGFVLREQRAQAADHVARAQVVAPHVGKDLAQCVRMHAVRVEQHLRGIDVRQNRAERLIHLVRDRCGQLAHGREPRGMEQLATLPLHRELGADAPLALNEQRRDQRGLRQDDGQRSENLPAIAIPGRELAEPDLAVYGQKVYVNAPMAQLPPVRDAARRDRRLDTDGSGILAIQYARDERTRALPLRLVARYRAGDDPIAEIGLKHAEYGNGRDLSNLPQHVTRHLWRARGVAEHRDVEHDRVRWKRSNRRKRFGQRATDDVLDRQRSGTTLDFRARTLEKPVVDFRRADDHGDTSRRGTKPQCEVNGRPELEPERHTGGAWTEAARTQCAARYADKDDRRTRP